MLSNISSEYLSYIVGFLQGDGSHSEQTRNRGKISVELSSKDIVLLDSFEGILNEIVTVHRSGRERDTNFKDNHKSCILTIHDFNLRKQLLPYIPVGKKSLKIEPPVDLPNFNKVAYLRGLTDADGSLGITAEDKPFWSLCTSSEAIKEFVLQDIKKELNFEKRIERNKRDSVYNISMFNEDAVIYTKLLYNDSGIHLDRKFEEYKKVQMWIRTVPKRPGRAKHWLPYEDYIVLDYKLSMKDKCKLLERSISSIKTRAWRLKQSNNNN